jgi:putative membrane protein
MAERDEFPDYLALERTFLAWVRTGLALMGFGFVVARFGLFLRELQAVPQATAAGSSGMSVWFGTALIVMGVFANLMAAWRHRQLVQQLDRGELPRPGSVAVNVLIALILALVGLAMAVYLLTVRSVPVGNSGTTGEGSMETTNVGLASWETRSTAGTMKL